MNYIKSYRFIDDFHIIPQEFNISISGMWTRPYLNYLHFFGRLEKCRCKSNSSTKSWLKTKMRWTLDFEDKYIQRFDFVDWINIYSLFESNFIFKYRTLSQQLNSICDFIKFFFLFFWLSWNMNVVINNLRHFFFFSFRLIFSTISINSFVFTHQKI